MAGLLIGEVSKRSGVPTPTIRYYEDIGLLPSPHRSASGYRRYSETTVEELQFIKKAQALGFSLDEIREIVKLSRAGTAPCSRVLTLAHHHLAALDQRIRQLQKFRDHLSAELTKWNAQPAEIACGRLCRLIADAGLDDGVPLGLGSTGSLSR